MRKLVLSILALIALFSTLRAWAEAVPAPGVELHPGLIEVRDGSSSVSLAFGIMEREAGQASAWNMLPLRIVYQNGGRSVSLAINGLSFLLRGGVSVGGPVRVGSPRAGNVVSIGGKVTVDAPVDGDVWALGADVDLSPRANVTGNVVAIGGRVTASARSIVKGTVNQMPEIRIPFLGLLRGQFSVQVLAFGRQVLGYLLLGAALFLSCFYGTTRARSLYEGFERTWRASLVTLAACLVLVPLAGGLLIVSVIGLFFLPALVFALAVLGLNGFLILCARLGGGLRRRTAAGADALHLFTSGLLGLFLVKLPALAGIVLTLVHSEGVARVGQVLQLVSLGLVIVGMMYGTGAALSNLRTRAVKTA